MKLPKSGSIDTYALAADLDATRYITIKATEQGAPVQDAVVKVAGVDAGTTDTQGLFVYEYKDQPKTGLDLAVMKPGYASWRKTGQMEPGQTIEAALSKRVIVTVSALMEEYGQTSGIPGVVVSINKKTEGKTDAKGVFTYTYDGEPGKKVQLSLSAPGSIPERWKTTITLDGEVAIDRYFYPATPKRIRTGIYRFAGNTPNVDLQDVVAQTEIALAAQLFKNACFREVPSKTLQADLKRARLNIDRIIVKGWRETPLRKTVDMIVLGSVAKDDKGYLIETKFYTSGGKLLLSHSRGQRVERPQQRRRLPRRSSGSPSRARWFPWTTSATGSISARRTTGSARERTSRSCPRSSMQQARSRATARLANSR
jgi:hypothetical protein